MRSVALQLQTAFAGAVLVDVSTTAGLHFCISINGQGRQDHLGAVSLVSDRLFKAAHIFLISFHAKLSIKQYSFTLVSSVQ